MTDDEIAAAWATHGDIARASRFSTFPDVPNSQRHLIADLGSLGKEGGMFVRVFRSIDINAAKEAIEAALDAMYLEIRDAPANARAYEWRKFEA